MQIKIILCCTFHVSAGFFRCDVVFLQGKHNGFCHIVANAYSEFFKQAANFDYTSKSIKQMTTHAQHRVISISVIYTSKANFSHIPVVSFRQQTLHYIL